MLQPIEIHYADQSGQPLDDWQCFVIVIVWLSQRWWQRNQMSRILPGQLHFALQILLRDLDVSQSHVGSTMAQQFHERWHAHTGAQHGGGVGMAELVRHDVSRDSSSRGSV